MTDNTSEIGEPTSRPGGVDKFDEKLGLTVAYRQIAPRESSEPPLPPLDQGSTVLAKGSVNAEGAYALPCDILLERDQTVPLRDGNQLYVDIYRPITDEAVPTVLAYTHYGKRGGSWNAVNLANQFFGVSPELYSGLQSTEAPDPGYWVEHGYAVVVADAAGTGYSTGTHSAHPGSATGRNIYDLVEWIAEQEWSNGKVGMNGNSYLASVQWFAAAEQPPHLAAIAPWEGLSDFYRDSIFRGGIRDTQGFWNDAVFAKIVGGGLIEESIGVNADRYPLFNAYWADKVPDFSSITVPAYVAASWTNQLHTHGTISAFSRIASKDKWLRVHNTQEWIDEADSSSVDDLRRFFDRYLKGESNGWEETPRVRLSILDPGGIDIVNRPEKEWPLARQQWRSLALDATTGSLKDGAVAQEGEVTYQGSELDSSAKFALDVTEELEITGEILLHLWVEAVEATDADIFAAVYKLDADGKVLHHFVMPNPAVRGYVETQAENGFLPATFAWAGPAGRIRASHRALDLVRSTEFAPFLLHDKEEPLQPGQPVALEISLWPAAFVVHPGERLVLEIGGHPVGSVHTGFLPDPHMPTHNRGDYRIRTGAAFDSRLILPIVE